MGNSSSHAKHKRRYEPSDDFKSPSPIQEEPRSPEDPDSYSGGEAAPTTKRQQSAPVGHVAFRREPSGKRLSLENYDSNDIVDRDVQVEAVPDDIIPGLTGRSSVSSVSDTDGFKRHRMREARHSLMSLRKQIPSALLSNLSPDLFNQLEKVSDEIIQLLQNEYLSSHLREMRDRREFLMRAANDLTVPDAEREVARWLSSTYLKRNAPQMMASLNTVTKQPTSPEPATTSVVKLPASQPEIAQLTTGESLRLLSIDENILSETVSEMSQEVARVLTKIDSWEFDCFTLDKECGRESLPIVMMTIFTQRDLFNSLGLSKNICKNYFRNVAKSYKDNPYHNYLHGCDVVVSMHFFMRSNAFQFVEDLEIFASLLASVCHDVGHPGNNNAFEINTESELAVTYNDESVLENFHIALAWRLMKAEGCDILEGLDRDQRKRVRRVMITSILATDMTKHVESARSLDELVQMKKADEPGWRNSPEFLPLALHTADIGNPAKPLAFYSQWVDRLMSEFFAQGDMELSLGLPVSQLCDRRTVDIPSGQVGFINFVIQPWFKSWAELLSERDQGPYVLELIEENFHFMDQKRSDIEATKMESTEPDLPPREASPVVVHEEVSEENQDLPLKQDTFRTQESETSKSVRFLPEPVSPRDTTEEKLLLDEATDTIIPLRDRMSGRMTPHSRSSKSFSIVGMTMSEIQNRLGEIRVSGMQSAPSGEFVTVTNLPTEDDENE